MEGELPHESHFALFAGKFCYDYIPEQNQTSGQVDLYLTREGSLGAFPSTGKLLFMLFDDETEHWKKAHRRWASSTCEEKTTDSSDTLPLAFGADKKEVQYAVKIEQHIRPRFWYFAIVGCDLPVDETVHYKVHATNNMWGWQGEFSLDHMGLYIVYMVFTVLFAVGFTATFCCSRARMENGEDSVLSEHPYIKLLLLSYVASLASCALFLMHYTLFLRDGFGLQRLRYLGVISATVANCTVFLIAILSSVGWAISNFSLPHRRLFFGMLVLVGGVTALSEFHAATAVDQSTKLYTYQSGPGALILVLKIFVFCWFAFQCKMTYDDEITETNRTFYKWLGISMGLWAMNVPVASLLSFNLSPWVRYKIVTSVECGARFFGQMFLSQLFCGPLSPLSRKNTFLPSDGSEMAEFGNLNG